MDRILAAWVAMLLVMFVGILVKRDLALDGLAVDITPKLRKCYATGNVDHSSYTGGWKTTSLQSTAVYLMERGRRYPQMERELLITESLRNYDWIFLYHSSWNYDLRMLLIDRCKKAFPDDAEVAWASGRILLTAGHYNRAVEELQRAKKLGLAYDKPWIHEKYVRGRTLAGLLMAGRVDDWQHYLHLEADADRQDEGAAYRYINALLVQGKYDQALREIENRKDAFDLAQGYSQLVARALFWGGQRTRFDRFISEGKRNATLRQSTRQWASAISDVKPPDFKLVLLLEDIEALTAQLESINKTYEKVREQKGWRAARQYSDQRQTVMNTALPFSVNSVQADYYAVSGDQTYVLPLMELRDELIPIVAKTGSYSSIHETNRIWRETNAYLGRCFALAHEWDRLIELHQKSLTKRDRWSRKDTYDLLAILASGESVSNDSNDNHYYRGFDIEPSLIASEEFQLALAHGGRDYDDVMAEIQEQMCPFRNRYYDYSNETLKIPWVKLEETDSHRWDE